jgi:hypothetical protein
LESSLSHSHSDDNNYNLMYSMFHNYVQEPQNSSHLPVQPTFETCSTEIISNLFSVVSEQTQSLASLNQKVEEIVEKNKELTHKTKEL